MHSPPNCLKVSWKLLRLFISINWPSLVTLWVVIQNIYSKMHHVSCTNTHYDVTDLVHYRMVKNRKTWISWEWNINFLRNKKILNLCLIWHILRKYCFVAEVTFKVTVSERKIHCSFRLMRPTRWMHALHILHG